MSKPFYPLAAAAALALGAAVWSLATAEEAAAPSPAPGPQLRSAGALEMGPGNVLFVADSLGSAVHAFEVELPEAAPAADAAPLAAVQDLDEKIAGLLGIGVRDVVVEDMAVHEPTATVFLSVTRGRGDEARPVLLRVTANGTLSEVAATRHSRLELSDAPPADAKLYRWESRTFTITDLEYIDGELYIAGLSNEEFASVLRRSPYPFEKSVRTTGLEIYHGAHGAYETFAPIFSFIPYPIEGKEHLLAGYLCSPLVTFPLDEVRSSERLRGKTIAELGYGNIPTDIVPYRNDGEDWVLITNSSRGAMKVKASEILAAHKSAGITTQVGPRTGVEDHTVPLGAVAQAASLGPDHVALLVRDLESGALHLTARPSARI